MSEPWFTEITDIDVHTTVPSLSGGDTRDDKWIHVFADESATNAVANGGAGMLVHFPGQKATTSIVLGKHCFNYCAETEALMQAASIIQFSDHNCTMVVFFSDTLSNLQTFQNSKLPNLAKALQHVAATRRDVLQWIPSHYKISGKRANGQPCKRRCQRTTACQPFQLQ